MSGSHNVSTSEGPTRTRPTVDPLARPLTGRQSELIRAYYQQVYGPELHNKRHPDRPPKPVSTLPKVARSVGYSYAGAVRFRRLDPRWHYQLSVLAGETDPEILHRLNPTYVLSQIDSTVKAAREAGKHAEALKGLELLGKYLGIWRDKVDVSGTISIAAQIKERYQSQAKSLRSGGERVIDISPTESNPTESNSTESTPQAKPQKSLFKASEAPSGHSDAPKPPNPRRMPLIEALPPTKSESKA